MQVGFPPELFFDDTYSSEQKRELRTIADSVAQYYARRFGYDEPGRCIKFGQHSYIDDHCVSTMYIYPSGDSYVGDFFTAMSHWGLSHEEAHVLQSYLVARRHGKPNSVFFDIPAWIKEGVAERWKSQYLEELGVSEGTLWLPTEDDLWRRVVFYGVESTPLDELPTGTRGLYPLAEIALMLLVRETSEEAPYNFFDQHHLHETWEEAFEAVFGFTVESFYVTYDAYREEQLALVEVVAIRGTVVEPNNRPLDHIRIYACQSTRGNCRTRLTGEDGRFTLLVPDGSFTLNVYSALGCSLVGWYGPGGFTTVLEDAISIEVDGESVEGIVIRLPDHPEALPFVGDCA